MASHSKTVTALVVAKRRVSPAASAGSTSIASTCAAAVRQRGGESAGAGAELDDLIRWRDAGVGREVRRERSALEEVLSEIPTVRPSRS